MHIQNTPLNILTHSIAFTTFCNLITFSFCLFFLRSCSLSCSPDFIQLRLFVSVSILALVLKATASQFLRYISILVFDGFGEKQMKRKREKENNQRKRKNKKKLIIFFLENESTNRQTTDFIKCEISNRRKQFQMVLQNNMNHAYKRVYMGLKHPMNT